MRTESEGYIRNNAQTVVKTIGNVIFDQSAKIGDNIQAANLALSSGFFSFIGDLERNLNAALSTSVDFDQIPMAAINLQAGNMAVLSITAGPMSEIFGLEQTFMSSDLATDFRQESSASNFIKAGNLIDLNGGSLSSMAPSKQTFEALGGNVSVTQLGGSSNIQALNATVCKANSFSPSRINQALTITSVTLVMVQENVTGSDQYDNFFGVKY